MNDSDRAAGDAGLSPPFVFLKPFILATASPRRRDFFQRLGLACPVVAAELEERHRPGEAPGEFARRLAQEKAMAVGHLHPASWVLGADTVVVLKNEILGKPRNASEALTMLQRLNGGSHRVISGYCLCHGESSVSETRQAESEVCFHRFSDMALSAYVASGEPLDKAGAYGIQGIGAFLVREIHGSCANVIGLPLAEVVQLLLQYRIIAPAGS